MCREKRVTVMIGPVDAKLKWRIAALSCTVDTFKSAVLLLSLMAAVTLFGCREGPTQPESEVILVEWDWEVYGAPSCRIKIEGKVKNTGRVNINNLDIEFFWKNESLARRTILENDRLYPGETWKFTYYSNSSEDYCRFRGENVTYKLYY